MKQYKRKTPLSINPQKFRTLVCILIIKKIIKRIELQSCYHFIKKQPCNNRKHQDSNSLTFWGEKGVLRSKLF